MLCQQPLNTMNGSAFIFIFIQSAIEYWIKMLKYIKMKWILILIILIFVIKFCKKKVRIYHCCDFTVYLLSHLILSLLMNFFFVVRPSRSVRFVELVLKINSTGNYQIFFLMFL